MLQPNMSNGTQQHKKQSVRLASTKEVYATNDYDMFKTIKGNRAVSRKHVDNLVKGIARRNLLADNPIIVNDKMEIIDGQHRLEAAKNNGWTIFYVVSDGLELSDVQSLNSSSKAWSGLDYLNSYVGQGNKDYNALAHFVKDYQIILSNAIVLLGGFSYNRSLWTKFKRGQLVVTDTEEAEAFAQAYLSLKAYCAPRVWNDREFMMALHVLFSETDVAEFIAKLMDYARPIEYKPTVREYLREFEDVINWRKKNLTRLY